MYEIRDKRKIISEMIDLKSGNEHIKNVKVICMGSDKIEPYIEDLAEIQILAIPFLLEEESIIFVEKVDD